jgi:hypothetical protein
MLPENIVRRAEDSIVKGDYIIGKETRYYILTIKLDGSNYLVKVMDRRSEASVASVGEKLEAAKKEGIRLLLKHKPGVELNDITMVHYKDDRPSGMPWLKDSELVIGQLLNLERNIPSKQINYTYLEHSLKIFDKYRETNEETYLNERGLKDAIVQGLRNVLLEFEYSPFPPQETIDRLIPLLAKGDIRGKLQKLFRGTIWLSDFIVFLKNTDPLVVHRFMNNIFDDGVTAEIRERLSGHYKQLFEAGKYEASKSKIETPVHILALVVASYDPNKYILYKPDSFGPYVEKLGFVIPHDPVERYLLYNEAAQLVFEYANEHGHNVQDLMDAYHVIYLANQFVTDEGGGLLTMQTTQPINKIFYGPPGTGKTYNVIYEALSILNPDMEKDLLQNPQRREEAVAQFNHHVDSNHITFCTFHQSFSYEEFVEGIRYNAEKNGYEVQDGVFKRLCNAARAVSSERRQTYNFDSEKTQFFKMSLGNSNNIEEDEVYEYCISNNVVALGWGDNVDFTDCYDKQSIREEYSNRLPDENQYGAEFVERFKHWMKVGDIVVISYGNKRARAIGKITGDYFYLKDASISYNQFRSVEWLYEDNEAMLPVQSILREKAFSQQTVYMLNKGELNLESIRELVSGDSGEKRHEQSYVLIIDEINRGNISKIFGELITLIEPDKRVGQRNELSVTLPYSGDRLRVPSNVHIIGTMNTADRSIALLDTALRRRFEFVEMLPDYSLLPTDVQGVNIRLLLETINKRIAYLYDRDHVIGHAYFVMNEPLMESYKSVMCSKIIPLLQEYFYDDWEQIELVLGGAGSRDDTSYFLNKETLQANHLFARGKTTSLEPAKTRYIVQQNPTHEAFKRVYDRISDSTNHGVLE